jgi:two-component system CheB/CheR fusion protein
MRQPSQELFRNLAELAPDALIMVAADGVILYANAHAHTLFGYEPGALAGAPIEQLIPHESRGQHAAHRTVYGQNPRLHKMGNRNMQLFGLRHDGTRFRAEIRLAPVKSAQGHVVAAAVRDVTETEQFMTMLAAARQVAEEANDAKGRLLAAASHDLRQPMQTLRLLNGAMQRLSQDPAMQDVLEQKARALSIMSELLHALLNVAKLESGSLQPSTDDVSLPAVFEDLRQQFGALAKLEKLDLVVTTPDVHVCTDRVLLTEMLQNLLANALRYTDRGQVLLSCIPDGRRRASIEVMDTGIGIPESARGRIFEDFFQVAARGEGHRGGTGLGLGIVRRLSQLLAIPVAVTSTVDAGTCFRLEVALIDAATSEVPEQEPTTAHHRGQTILLIEDDKSMRDALRTYLQLDDHDVWTASSLADVTELLPRLARPPAIVISDFHLGPTERGTDAIDRVRQYFQRAIPAILLTGDTSAVPARFSSAAGVRMLNKPVDTQRLVAWMDELLQAAEPRLAVSP